MDKAFICAVLDTLLLKCNTLQVTLPTVKK